MKTALQELIEKLENCKEMFTKDTNVHKQIRVTYQHAIIIAHTLLKKEKEVIETAFDGGKRRDLM